MKNVTQPIKDKKKIEEIEKILFTHNKRNHLIWAIMMNTGLRISDVLSLNIEDVENKTYVEIREKKTGKYKRFPLNMKLQKLIKGYLKNDRPKVYAIDEDNEPLFVGKKHKRLDRSQVYRFIVDVCKQVGLVGNYSCHSCRKSFSLFFYRKYNDIALLQKILNHSSPAITLRYIGLDQEEIDYSYNNFEL